MPEYDDLTAGFDDSAFDEDVPLGEQIDETIRRRKIIKTPEDAQEAVEQLPRRGPTIQDRKNIDLEWLKRRAGKKK